MSNYDVLLIHPPAVYDFRRTPLFPGAMGPSVESVQFTKVPIGMLSVAEYLDRHGYKVVLDNLGDRMVNMSAFDVEGHLKNCTAQVYAVGMHFQQHAQGAIEIARLCKKLHPGSLVVMGGLTATCFHEEILQKYDFVDGVVRAEAEKALLALLRAVEKHGRLMDTPNLTYRDADGEIRVMPLMPASENLDEFEYTRFDLLQPKTSVYSPDTIHRYSLEVCRGCAYNCTICGGSAYTYKKHLGMRKPAFRSPAKIVADMKKLNDQGIYFIGLFQDARMGGKKYRQELMAALAREKPKLERLSLDLLVPADEDFIREISAISRRVMLHLCPDTGSDAVRKLLGRHYSNTTLLESIKMCHKHRIPVTYFFSAGLAGETAAEVKETWALCEQLAALDRDAMERGCFADIRDTVPIGWPIVGPIVIDPGSKAFHSPEAHGYKLRYRNLEEYIHGLSQPAWPQWLNYETHLLSRDAIVDVIFQSMEFIIDLKARYGFYNSIEAVNYDRNRLEADRLVVQQVERLMKTADPPERDRVLAAMRKNLDAFLE